MTGRAREKMKMLAFKLIPQRVKCHLLGWHTVDFAHYDVPRCIHCLRGWLT